jgi:shikimate dehydrogenase
MKITARTQVCAVMGDPVGHSLSPELHNAAFEALGLDYAYVAFPVKRGNGGAAMQAVRTLGLRGLSVTIPFKLEIIPHLDQVDEQARHVGSVNTVVNEEGRLLGSSTDGPGALRALEAAGVDIAGRRVLVLGSGGAARAVVFALALAPEKPRSLSILGIEAAELKTLALDLASRTRLEPEAHPLAPDSLEREMREAEIIVHATPIGMSPRVDESVVPARLFRPEHAVFDVVYTPLETRLLREARAAGARVVPGVGMFVHQAAIQFEAWTRAPAPIEVMTRTVLEALARESAKTVRAPTSGGSTRP